MPTRVTLPTSPTTSSAPKLTLVGLPRRHEVLGSLRAGDRLPVLVLEKYADGKVLLDIKGAAVTAKAQGDFPVGARLEVVVQREGQHYVLRRPDQEDAALEALLRLVRSRLPGLDDRNRAVAQLLTGRTLQTLAGAKSGLANLYARLGQLLRQLWTADDNLAPKLAQLAVLFGLAPTPLGDRLRELFGRNVPGLLDRILSSGKADYQQLLAHAESLTPEEAERLTQLAGAMKEQIGLFRGLNALFEARGLPVHWAFPLVYQGEPQPTELWLYKGRDHARQTNEPETFSALLRLRLSALGEVRALVVVRRTQAHVSLYTENEHVADLFNRSRAELQDGLQAAGLNVDISVAAGLAVQPVPDVHETLYTAADTRGVSIKA
jgi:hypothetical protein